MDAILAPTFEKIVVDGPLSDGYWIDAVDINRDGKLDLIASGLAEGHVVWYENPGDGKSAGWKKHHIRQFPKPVALDHACLDGDRYEDLVVCHDYGNCMFDCGPDDGKISWLKNPGSFDKEADWEVYPIANLVATHRLRLGHFTSTERLELMAVPVVSSEPDGVHKPVHVTLYQVPEHPSEADGRGWSSSIVTNSSYRVIHDVVLGKFGGSADPSLESIILACEEGIVWLYYDGDQKWHPRVLGTGVQANDKVICKDRRFKGSGNLAVGRIGDDPMAYIATLEPFHGNTVAIYSKVSGTTLADSKWERTVLDVFGDQDEKSGEGAGHHVVAADFDKDGNDEFLVALRGPMPWQGVFYYKAIDAKNGVFVKTRVSSSSAARIAVADFDGDGWLDFATTGYYTPGYFLADNPQILVFLNKMKNTSTR